MTDIAGWSCRMGTEADGKVPVDALRFVGAFVGAPLVVALLGCWAIVPLFAVAFGAPFWVLLGAPALWLALRRGLSGPVDFAALGFVVNLMTPVLVWLYSVVSGDRDAVELVMFFTLFGAVMAPLWGAAFGWLYG